MSSTWDDPVATWDSPTVAWDSGVVVAPPHVPRPRRRRRIPRQAWSIDGHPVDLAEPSWSASEGGYDTASGRVTKAVARRIYQGSILRMETDGGPGYEGRLAHNPLVSEGSALIQAVGYKAAAEKSTGRLLYQSRDYAEWQVAGDPPFDSFTNSNSIEVSVNPAAILWTIAKGEDVGAIDAASAVFWAEGSPGGVSRIAWGQAGDNAYANMKVELRRFTGPNGARTAPALSLNADSSLHEHVFVTPEDAVQLFYGAAGVFTASAKKRLRVRNLRVNGIAPGDDFKTSEVAVDMGKRLGWDTSGVQDSALNALPLDIQEGNWLEAGLLYVAMLDNWTVRVLDDRGSGPYLEYLPRGSRVWNVTLAQDTRADLVPLALFNRVTVHFERENGAHRQRSVDADPDPLARVGITNVWEEELADPQPNGELAEAVANNILPQVSSPRYQGRLEIARASLDGGGGSIFDILPGDQIRVGDWGPAEAMFLPVSDVEWSPTGAIVGVEMEATADRFSAKRALRAARQWRRVTFKRKRR